MSRLDVVKSLLRSTVRSAATGLQSSAVGVTLQRALREAGLSRITVGDGRLTQAVARIPGVVAATVSTAANRVRVDASFDDGKRLAVSLRPATVHFAAGGAKELGFEVEQAETSFEPRVLEIVGAIAAEIARGLWRAALARAPRSDQGGVASRDGGRVIVDLRSVPEVRWALRQRLPAAMIEALTLRSLESEPGRLLLRLSFDRLLATR
ncbi:MAG: hypothetical protein ACHQ53_10545 [Polyangiales bacterium]